MCDICNQGSLGYDDDGVRAFCNCRAGVRAALDDCLRRLTKYADRLATYGTGDLPTLTNIARSIVQDAYDFECLVHDGLEAKLEAMR